MFIVEGSIDISPPLAWSEVQPTGFMVMNARGEPKAPPGRYVRLVDVEQLIDRPEGTLHKFTFASIVATTEEIPVPERPVFQAQIAAIVAAFPTHVFGGVSRIIKFRGEAFNDWRVRLNNDGTVSRQEATVTWVDVP